MAKKKENKKEEMEKKEGHKEDECKQSHHEDESESHHEDESESHEADEDADSSGDHADEEQDIQLIKKMLKDYLGDDHEGMDDESKEAMHSLAKEAYEGHKEMGKSSEEAFKHAGEAVKLAHHMAQKQSKTESEDQGDPEQVKDKAAPKKAAKPDPKDDDGSDDKAEGHKESKREQLLAKKLLEAEGRLAALESKAKKAEVTEYVDKKLKESGQPNAITKRFLEAAGELKTKKDFDSRWGIFLEGVKNTRTEIDWTAISEKSSFQEDGSKTHTSKLDFSGCVEE
jgi:hypothetical protein